ncbi:MAG: ribonuclease HII [Patescibacteria group bacterium]|nr:ribonuclease HII [Patescibacteria group bacterium]MDE2438062.1 ribonuclease HII [Patescibacteria group bacterium]
MNLWLEKKLWHSGYDTVIGIDEVGRGSLAGPLVLCGVMIRQCDLPQLKKIKGVNDSKKLAPAAREEIFSHVKQFGIPYVIQRITPRMIDAKNIYRAAIMGCNGITKKCERVVPASSRFVVCDGGLFVPRMPSAFQETFIKGDARVFSIALASIVAKQVRDALMVRFSKIYPIYGWDKNKGYGTKAHRDALQAHGVTPFHRVTFTTACTKPL